MRSKTTLTATLVWEPNYGPGTEHAYGGVQLYRAGRTLAMMQRITGYLLEAKHSFK